MFADTQSKESAWLEAMIKLEGELGEFPPGGFAGGLVAQCHRAEKARLEAEATKDVGEGRELL